MKRELYLDINIKLWDCWIEAVSGTVYIVWEYGIEKGEKAMIFAQRKLDEV